MDQITRKHRFLEALGIVIIVVALVKCGVSGTGGEDNKPDRPDMANITNKAEANEANEPNEPNEAEPTKELPVKPTSTRYLADGERPHRIWSVPSYQKAFPDSNSVQLTAANRWGVKPVKNRQDAEERKDELVYIGCSPYYIIDPLHSSIPYLVPRAAIMLQDIGQAFFDSLQVKGVPLHRLIVTSVLRTQEDVKKLRRRNGNATENSCHLYGTTIDICYNRYQTVEDPDGPKRREVRNDSLKFILSEVLNDMRRQNRCYIKYEVKQGCFHMTVR